MVKLTHANFNRPVHVNPNHVAAVYYSESGKSTHIISVGAIIPVSETVEEVLRLITNKETIQNGMERKD